MVKRSSEVGTFISYQLLRGHESGVWAVAFSADGKQLASGGLDQTAKLWNLERQRPNDALKGVEQPFAWSPDSTMLASAHSDWTAKIWDSATLKPHRILPGVSHFLAFSQDGKTVSTTRTNGTVAFWEVATGKVQREVQTLVPLEKWDSVVVSTDRQMIGVGHASGAVGLWEISSGNNERLTGHTRQAAAVTFSPDSGTLISAHSKFIPAECRKENSHFL